jgi:stage V sporulation protein B
MLKFGLIVMTGNIVFTGYTLFDLTFIGSFIGASALAYYSVSATASRYIHGVVGSLLLPLFPLASAHSSIENQNFTKIFYKANKVSIIFSVYLCLILCILSQDLLNIWMGSKFVENSEISFVLLVLSWTIFSFTIVSFQTSEGFGFPKYNLYFAMACSILSVTFYYVLIPKYGINGAALSRLFSIILVAPFYILIIEKKLFKSIKYIYWIKTLLSILFTSFIIYLSLFYLRPFFSSIIFRIAFSLILITILFPILIYIFGIFDKSEKYYIKNYIINLFKQKQEPNETNQEVIS